MLGITLGSKVVAISVLVIRDRTLWVIIKADWLKKKHRQTWCVVKSSVMLIDLG